MNDNKRKKILLIVGVILTCVLVVGGTYAYLTFSVSVTNGKISDSVECFEIDYSILNDASATDSSQITGTLFPSAGPNGGLSGKVSINVNSNCKVKGTGTLYLNVDSGTSTTLVQTVAAHCEDKTTLETMKDYTTSAECTADSSRMWVSTGTGLKYAVYSNANATGTPLNVGYITNSDIGGDIPIYSDFDVVKTASSYYIFIWMDGYITDSTYTELPFGGYIHASVLQNEEEYKEDES